VSTFRGAVQLRAEAYLITIDGIVGYRRDIPLSSLYTPNEKQSVSCEEERAQKNMKCSIIILFFLAWQSFYLEIRNREIMNGGRRTTCHHITSLILALIFFAASIISSGMIGEPAENVEGIVPDSNDDPGPLNRHLSETSRAFTENRGQMGNGDILFYYEAGDHSVGFMQGGYVLTSIREDHENSSIQVIFDGSSEVEPEGVGPKGYETNHISGNDRSQWITGIPEYEKIFYQDLYPGIDLVFYHSQEGLKYDWIVGPFADPTVIRETYSGIDSLSIGEDGSLVVAAGEDTVRQEAPETYQVRDGKRATIPSNYLIEEGSTVIYDIGDYDVSRELVIDPLLGGTFLGTWGVDAIYGVETDREDNIYVMGYTNDKSFPTTEGCFSTPPVGYDIFITKFDPLLREIKYSTIIGGWRHEDPSAFTVDDDGFVYVALKTMSDDFPTTNGSYQEELVGMVNSVVFKLSPDGSELVFSTYIPGDMRTEIRDMVLDEDNNILLAGDNSNKNITLLKLSADGSEVLASSEFGGNDYDWASSLTLDHEGNVLVAGSTRSQDFPTTPGCFQPENGGPNKTGGEAADGFITKLNGNFSSILYSSFLGGNNSDGLNAIAQDPTGGIIVVGSTGSENFPTTPGCIDADYAGAGADMTITKLNQNGSALVYSTYYNSLGDTMDSGQDIVIDSRGNACVGGLTYFGEFPTTPNSFLPKNPGGGGHGWGTAVVVIVDPEGSLLYSTHASGSSEDYIEGITVDSQDNIIVAGHFVDGADFLPTLPGCYDTSGHDKDGYIVKFNTMPVPYPFMTIDPKNTFLDYESIPLAGLVPSDSAIIRYVWTVDNKEVYNGTERDYQLPPLPLGNYSVRFGALNEAGFWKETPDQNFIVHSRPAVTILHPQQLVFLDTDALEFTGIGMDDGAITSFSWRIGAEYVNSTNPDLVHAPLSSGKYTITVRVQDDHEVWSNETSIDIRVVTRPEAAITPFPNEIYSSDSIIPFRCTSDGRGITIVHWTSSIDGEFAVQNMTSINLTGLSAGNHELNLRIQDEWGFWSTTTTVRLNITARPVALIRSISPNPALYSDILEFKGAGIDDQAITSYVWESDTDGILSHDADSVFATTGLSIGIHTITLKVQDDDGFWSNVVSFELQITNRPEAFIDSILPDPLVSDMFLELSGHGQDDGSISFLEWSSDIDGKLITTSKENVSISGLSPGIHTISLRSCDDLGFWSEPATALLTVHERPVASIPYISLSAAMVGSSVTFRGVGSDDGQVTGYSWSSDRDGNLSSQSAFTCSGLSRGVHTISLRVLDDTGCWSNPANRVVAIMSRPIAVITNISHESSLKGETISLTGYGADDVAIEEVRWQSSIDGSIGSESSMKTSELSPGSHLISFQARDEHGLWSDPVFRNITVHTRPTAEIISLLPETPSTEDLLTLKGTGADDGEIFRYRWHSSIDGELFNGTWEEASVKPLSQGTHTITFAVQDDQGIWSDEEIIVVEVVGPKDDESPLLPLLALLSWALLLLFITLNAVIHLPASSFDKEAHSQMQQQDEPKTHSAAPDDVPRIESIPTVEKS